MFKKLLAYSLIFIFTIQLAQSLNTRLLAENTQPSPSIQLPLNHISDRSLVYAALPSQTSLIKTSLKTADARPEIVRQYLQKYHSVETFQKQNRNNLERDKINTTNTDI